MTTETDVELSESKDSLDGFLQRCFKSEADVIEIILQCNQDKTFIMPDGTIAAPVAILYQGWKDCNDLIASYCQHPLGSLIFPADYDPKTLPIREYSALPDKSFLDYGRRCVKYVEGKVTELAGDGFPKVRLLTRLNPKISEEKDIYLDQDR